MMFDTLYGLTVNEVQKLERENCMAAHLMVLRDGFQVEYHKVNVSRSCCSWLSSKNLR